MSTASFNTSISKQLFGLKQKLKETATERDRIGGTAFHERQLIRDSGLLRLFLPKNFGGAAQSWPVILRGVREIASVDSSLAHIFGFQHLILATIQLFGTPRQTERFFAETGQGNLFWGNALNPLDTRTLATRTDGQLFINGHKGFCSGARDSDRLLISALNEDGRLLVAAIPSDREGITIHDDWDNIGQRQTDSGSVEFHQVELFEDEILSSPGPLGSTLASLRPLIAQLSFCNIYLGIAQGALEEAIEFTKTQGRPWFASGLKQVGEDPYILRRYGELTAEIRAAEALTDNAALKLQAAWERGDNLTPDERGQCALDIAAAKVITTQTGLQVSTKIFDVMGARATTAALRLDRYWRNVRVHTLHDPVDYKLHDLGDWVLNQHLPIPSFYS
jgi:alkylation response protein AidB-like acyl-CoA dehydrogenase